MNSIQPRMRLLHPADSAQLRYLGLLRPENDGWQKISPHILHLPNYITGTSEIHARFSRWSSLTNELKDAVADRLSDPEFWALSYTCKWTMDHFEPERAKRRKAFIRIPVFGEGRQLFEYLGFRPEVAEALSQMLSLRHNKYQIVEFVRKLGIVHLGVAHWNAHPVEGILASLGVTDDLEREIINTTWQTVRNTQSALYWFCDTVSIRLSALYDVASSSWSRASVLHDVCPRCRFPDESGSLMGDNPYSRLVGMAALTTSGKRGTRTHQSFWLPCCYSAAGTGRCIEDQRQHSRYSPRTSCLTGLDSKYSGPNFCYRKQLSEQSIYRAEFELEASNERRSSRPPVLNSADKRVRLYFPTTLHQLDLIGLCPSAYDFRYLGMDGFSTGLASGLVSYREAPIVLYEWRIAQAMACYANDRARGYTKGVVMEVTLPLSIFEQMCQHAPYDVDLYLAGDSQRKLIVGPPESYKGPNYEQKVPDHAWPYKGSPMRNFRVLEEPDWDPADSHLISDRRHFQYDVWQHRVCPDWCFTPLFTPKLVVGPIPLDRHRNIAQLSGFADISPDFILWHDDIPQQQKAKHQTWNDVSNDAGLQFILPWLERGSKPHSELWCEALGKNAQISVRDLNWEPEDEPGVVDGREFLRLLTKWKGF